MNMARNEQRKNFSRDIFQVVPNGPLTVSLVLVWNALFKPMITRDDGQTAMAG